jgi:hypothetical protein
MTQHMMRAYLPGGGAVLAGAAVGAQSLAGDGVGAGAAVGAVS